MTSKPTFMSQTGSQLVASLLLIAALANNAYCQQSKSETPAPRREFRAAWIATVANIDWPSKPGLSTREQKEELLSLIERAAELNLNAIVFQVRPHCDALYASELEPWSEYLTGTQGKAPEPFYDPLEMAIEECHRRGIELHAWFNPYRASHPSGKSELSDSHISKTVPEAVREYGKHLWLDPGDKSAARHSLEVILDVVRRYDVDGIHFDDYFYPYPISDKEGKPVDFPDDASWQAAQAAGEKLSRNDWRRQNVDQFIAQVGQEIKKVKPWVKYGISPFGIWRPGHPKSVVGFDAYEKLYADSLKWFREGSVDYLTPQLYWRMNSSGQSYPRLLNWWHEQNEQGRHLWPGQYTSKLFAGGSARWPAEEIVAQVWATRAQEGASGNVHFSMKALARNSGGIADVLKAGPYHEPALVPASPWLAPSSEALATPVVSVKQDGELAAISLSSDGGQLPWQWALAAKYGEHWQIDVLPGHEKSTQIPTTLTRHGVTYSLESVALSAVDRLGQQSDYSTTNFPFP
ncbi:glycoside hydrolase family 10 protein [Adhaeretor mobilis]|uniref:Glycosyl hydrolase-like 10 domain-containing protein n=1 Tax=Adhaeretor mobilis TaxID=1930276 RepID=A0A517MTR9_9BACT|nr:family 10 glycosylhydrolase [Adhaeretor mobilis]QDS98285.1 hypothetical protein HG15A2_15580 [Adhaeretor mobilis]